jgi:hypothetical protein
VEGKESSIERGKDETIEVTEYRGQDLVRECFEGETAGTSASSRWACNLRVEGCETLQVEGGARERTQRDQHRQGVLN